MDYTKLFPQHLIDNEDYAVFIRVISDELSLSSGYIELFPTLVDIDTCPESMLPHLASLLGYTYKYNFSPKQNREVMKRIFEVHRARGSQRDLEMMATYGDNPGYIGGNVFMPGTYEPREIPEIRVPRHLLFKHSVSSRSGSHHYPDSYNYNSGILEVWVANRNITDEHKARIETVKPAGIKLLYAIKVQMLTDENFLVVSKPVLDTDVSITIDSTRTAGLLSSEDTGTVD